MDPEVCTDSTLSNQRLQEKKLKTVMKNVRQQLPKSINKDENRAAVTDFVISSTVRKVDGTRVAPMAVQN